MKKSARKKSFAVHKKKDSFFTQTPAKKEEVEAKKEDIVEELEENFLGDEDDIGSETIESPSIGSVKPPKNRFYRNRMFQISALLFIALLIIGLVFTYQRTGRLASTVNNDKTPQQVMDLIEEVGKIYLLPEGETPTVATVSDITKLADDPFFKNAQNGDKVLMIRSTQQAILYRQSIKKILAVAAINPAIFNQPQQGNDNASSSAQVSVTPTEDKADEKLKVVVLNSTKTVGLAKKAGDLLDEDKYEVIRTSNSEGEYSSTTISSAVRGEVENSKLSDIASTFTKIKPEITALPSGEAAPAGADVVIIVGSDFDEAY